MNSQNALAAQQSNQASMAQANQRYQNSGAPKEYNSPPKGTIGSMLSDIMMEANQKAAEIEKAKTISPEAGRDKLNEVIYGIINKKIQKSAAEWDACRKSPECMDKMQSASDQEISREAQEQDRIQYDNMLRGTQGYR
jgi:hypothetical protein